jgi:hypothetical protein
LLNSYKKKIEYVLGVKKKKEEKKRNAYPSCSQELQPKTVRHLDSEGKA